MCSKGKYNVHVTLAVKNHQTPSWCNEMVHRVNPAAAHVHVIDTSSDMRIFRLFMHKLCGKIL